MTHSERDLYGHMDGEPDDVTDLGFAPGASVSPRFSLAYLRRSSDPVALLTAEGRVTFLNDPACVFLGLPSAERAQGLDLWEYWPEVEAQALKAAVLEAARGAPAILPSSCPAADEDVKRYCFTASPVIDGEGRVESVFVVISDAD